MIGLIHTTTGRPLVSFCETTGRFNSHLADEALDDEEDA